MLFRLINIAHAADPKVVPKVIPIAEVGQAQIVLAWLSANEERTMLLMMLVTWVSREIYGFVKIKFGKVGVQLEQLKEVPGQIQRMQEEQKEQSEDIKALIKGFNKFQRDIDGRIRDEVRYALDIKERR